MISFNQIIENDDYRQRVIKFFRLPIRLSVTKEKFLSDLDFIKYTDLDKYNMIIEYTESDFNTLSKEQGTTEPDFTMEDILEPILDSIEENQNGNHSWRRISLMFLMDIMESQEYMTFTKKKMTGRILSVLT